MSVPVEETVLSSAPVPLPGTESVYSARKLRCSGRFWFFEENKEVPANLVRTGRQHQRRSPPGASKFWMFSPGNQPPAVSPETSTKSPPSRPHSVIGTSRRPDSSLSASRPASRASAVHRPPTSSGFSVLDAEGDWFSRVADKIHEASQQPAGGQQAAADAGEPQSAQVLLQAKRDMEQQARQYRSQLQVVRREKDDLQQQLEVLKGYAKVGGFHPGVSHHAPVQSVSASAAAAATAAPGVGSGTNASKNHAPSRLLKRQLHNVELLDAQGPEELIKRKLRQLRPNSPNKDSANAPGDKQFYYAKTTEDQEVVHHFRARLRDFNSLWTVADDHVKRAHKSLRNWEIETNRKVANALLKGEEDDESKDNFLEKWADVAPGEVAIMITEKQAEMRRLRDDEDKLNRILMTIDQESEKLFSSLSNNVRSDERLHQIHKRFQGILETVAKTSAQRSAVRQVTSSPATTGPSATGQHTRSRSNSIRPTSAISRPPSASAANAHSHPEHAQSSSLSAPSSSHVPSDGSHGAESTSPGGDPSLSPSALPSASSSSSSSSSSSATAATDGLAVPLPVPNLPAQTRHFSDAEPSGPGANAAEERGHLNASATGTEVPPGDLTVPMHSAEQAIGHFATGDRPTSGPGARPPRRRKRGDGKMEGELADVAFSDDEDEHFYDMIDEKDAALFMKLKAHEGEIENLKRQQAKVVSANEDLKKALDSKRSEFLHCFGMLSSFLGDMGLKLSGFSTDAGLSHYKLISSNMMKLNREVRTASDLEEIGSATEPSHYPKLFEKCLGEFSVVTSMLCDDFEGLMNSDGGAAQLSQMNKSLENLNDGSGGSQTGGGRHISLDATATLAGGKGKNASFRAGAGAGAGILKKEPSKPGLGKWNSVRRFVDDLTAGPESGGEGSASSSPGEGLLTPPKIASRKQSQADGLTLSRTLSRPKMSITRDSSSSSLLNASSSGSASITRKSSTLTSANVSNAPSALGSPRDYD